MSTTKKSAKKSTAKAAAAKVNRNNEMTIHLTGNASTLRGKRQETFKRISDGMTVEELQTKMVKRFKGDKNWMHRTWMVLDAAAAANLVTLKAA